MYKQLEFVTDEYRNATSTRHNEKTKTRSERLN